MKTCRVCEVAQPEEEFYKNSSRCRKCDREYLRNWERKNPEKTKKYWEESYAKNKESIQRSCRLWEVNHPSQVTLLQHRRRARLMNAFVEDVSLEVLYERDFGICGICKESCQKEDASIDHIVPLSKFGEHSYANTQVAHRSCNSRKSNIVSEEFGNAKK